MIPFESETHTPKVFEPVIRQFSIVACERVRTIKPDIKESLISQRWTRENDFSQTAIAGYVVFLKVHWQMRVLELWATFIPLPLHRSIIVRLIAAVVLSR